MPHGLDAPHIAELIEKKEALWVRPLSDHNKSKKPMRVIGIQGNAAVLEIEEGGRKRQIRVLAEKLERTATPIDPHAPKPKPKPSAPPIDPEAKRLAELSQMFPLLVEQSKPAEPPKAEEPPVSKPAAPAYVLYEVKGKRYYTAKHTFTWDIDLARRYDTQNGANKAGGRLMGKDGQAKGKQVVVLREDLAREMHEAQKKEGDVKAVPDAPAPPAEPEVVTVATCDMPKEAVKTIGEHLHVATTPSPAEEPIPFPGTMSQEMATLQTALEEAMRNEQVAYELLQHRKVEVSRVKHAIDLFITRKKNQFR